MTLKWFLYLSGLVYQARYDLGALGGQLGYERPSDLAT